MRRKKKQFLRFISEHERAPSILARQKSFIEVAVSPRHGQLNHSSSKRGVQHSNRQFSIKSANGDHTHEKSQLPKADKDLRAEAKRKSAANMGEDVPGTSIASIPNPADTAMGPRMNTMVTQDKRKRKRPAVLKRFARFIEPQND